MRLMVSLTEKDQAPVDIRKCFSSEVELENDNKKSINYAILVVEKVNSNSDRAVCNLLEYKLRWKVDQTGRLVSWGKT